MSVYSDLIVAAGPSWYAPCNDTVGPVTPLVGTTTLAVTGAPTFGDPAPWPLGGRSIKFPATGTDYVQAGAGANAAFDLGDGPFSIEFWYKAVNTAVSGVALSKGATATAVRQQGTGPGRWALTKTGTADCYVVAGSPDMSGWHHVVVTRALATQPIIYVDGAVSTQTSYTAETFANTTTGFCLGVDAAAKTTSPWNGWLAHVALYTKVLTAAQVSAHFAAGSGAGSQALLPFARHISGFRMTPMWLAQQVTLGNRSVSAGTADFSAAGVTAAVVLAAPAGTVSVSDPGVTAAVTIVAPAGSVSVSITGPTATVVIAAPAGTISTTMPGVTATVVLAAPAGGFSTLTNFSANGVTAAVTIAAPAGVVSVGLPGATGTVVIAAPAGQVSVTLPGATGTVVIAAPAGSVSVGLPGVTATVVLAAPAGTVSVTMPGVTATVVIGAPAGGFSLLTDFSAHGVTATAVLAAPAGTISVTLPGTTATVVLAAPVGRASVDITGLTAAVAVAAVAGRVSVALPGRTATLVIAASPGAIGAPYSAAGVTATLVLAAYPGTAGAVPVPPITVTGSTTPTAGASGGTAAAAAATGSTAATVGASGGSSPAATVTGSTTSTTTVN